MKKHLSLLLTLLCVLLLSATALAADVASGTCGDDLTWTVYDDGTLNISGTGAMTDFAPGSAPWYSYRDSIRTVIIRSGVTTIGSYAFADCQNLVEVYYAGTEKMWNTIAIASGNDPLVNIAPVFAGTLLRYTDSAPYTQLMTRLDFIRLIAARVNLNLDANFVDHAFTDCSGLTPDENKIISAVCAYGLLRGRDSNLFDPNGYITRAEIATVLYRFATGDTAGTNTGAYAANSIFSDVPSTVWYAGAVNYCVSVGYISGNSGDAFRGTIPPTFYEAMQWMLNVPPTDFFNPLFCATSGTCGETLKWVLSTDGTLTIDGTGAMDDYDNKGACAPWIVYRDYIKTLWIGSGVTTIGDYAFDSCTALTEIRYPGSETQWNTIAIGANNQPLNSAILQYNYVPVVLDGLVMDENGLWWYYVDGVLQTNFTGLVYFNGTFFYVQNGKLDTSYVGLVEFYGAWYYVEGGIINFNFTGLTYFNGTFFYIQNGVLDTSYVGLVEFYGAWYYVEGGIINFNFTGLTYFAGTFFYIQNGVLDVSYVGLVEFYGAWYYVEGGIINFAFTGLTYFAGTFFYIQNGVLDTSYVGLVEFYGAYYYVSGGIIDFSYTGQFLFNGTYFNVVGGIVQP